MPNNGETFYSTLHYRENDASHCSPIKKLVLLLTVLLFGKWYFSGGMNWIIRIGRAILPKRPEHFTCTSSSLLIYSLFDAFYLFTISNRIIYLNHPWISNHNHQASVFRKLFRHLLLISRLIICSQCIAQLAVCTEK